jgi:hypothetical protein
MVNGLEEGVFVGLARGGHAECGYSVAAFREFLQLLIAVSGW